ELVPGPEGREHADEPGLRFAADGRGDVRMAHAGAVRAGAAFFDVASGGARLFLSHVAHLLVAGGAAVAQQDAVAALGDGAISADCGPAEHRAVSYPVLFRSRAL